MYATGAKYAGAVALVGVLLVATSGMGDLPLPAELGRDLEGGIWSSKRIVIPGRDPGRSTGEVTTGVFAPSDLYEVPWRFIVLRRRDSARDDAL